MNKLLIATTFLALTISCAEKEEEIWVDHAIEIAGYQYQEMAQKALERDAYPRNVEPDGNIKWVGPHDWTSGFFPGSLFHLYRLTEDTTFKSLGIALTKPLHVLEYDSSTHDLGFMIYCSYGNAYDINPENDYAELMLNGANGLYSRYDKTVGCIQSWDFGRWQYPVIIDNMMNLEYLFWASDYSGNNQYYDIAVAHANTTLENHFRDDFSSYHVLDYDTITGEVLSKETFQGYSDSSAWSRGQAWGLYGYTVVYRETKDQKHLDQAKGIANFILSHPNLPEDKIPYWDFNAPDIPNAPRDASAAAVTASALLELSGYVDNGEEYFYMAEQILKSLSSPEYLAEMDGNNHFILKHSTGFKPNSSEVDVPLNYADYYYLEALHRYIQLKNP